MGKKKKYDQFHSFDRPARLRIAIDFPPSVNVDVDLSVYAIKLLLALTGPRRISRGSTFLRKERKTASEIVWIDGIGFHYVGTVFLGF